MSNIADIHESWCSIASQISTEINDVDSSNNEVINMLQFKENIGCSSRRIFEWVEHLWRKVEIDANDYDTPTKSNIVSQYWRNKGNECYKRGDFEDALAIYSQSMKYAVTNEQFYGITIGNRSASLAMLGRFQEGLEDIERALQLELPNPTKMKVLMRKADCYIGLNRSPEGRVALEEAKSFIPIFTELTETEKAKVIKNMYSIESTMDMLDICEFPLKPGNDVTPLPNLKGGQNPNFYSASVAVEINYEESVGRYVVSAAPLVKGDILFVEKPYASVVLRDESSNASIACEVCCKDKLNLIPCSQCSRTLFCSEECCAVGWNSFHKWECKGAQMDLWPAIGIGHLALRCLIVTTNKGFPHVENMEAGPITASTLFDIYSQYGDKNLYNIETPDFLRVFNLVTNFDKMSNENYVQYFLMAVMLMKYLKFHTDFISSVQAKTPFEITDEELELFLSALLLRFLGQVICNANTIIASRTDIYNIETKQVPIGTGIYPSVSMMNHSCDPNIECCFNDNCLIVRCLRDTPIGGKVENCYGPNRASHSTDIRKKNLSEQYYFNCRCAACIAH